MDTLRACALLARAQGLSAEKLRSAAAALGSLEQVAAGGRDLDMVDLPSHVRAFLQSPDITAIESDLRWIEENGAHLIPCTAPEYPALLSAAPGSPPVLYVLGDPACLRSPQLAMVGSRTPTITGRETARKFAAFFARSGLTVTSGLALGIDGACHEGALAGGGMTVAVCGHGLDDVYPRRHRALARRIRRQGALVSEFPPGVQPLPENFPRRNRIISALALGTLVVEAARRSGSLITARLAAEQGREVFAIPGSIHNPMSRGCHKLIRDGAKLVESGADVLSELKFSFPVQEVAKAVQPSAEAGARPGALDKEYEMLLDALGFEPASIDTLVERTGLPGESVASMLLILELEGRVAPNPGGRYCRLE